MKLILLLGFIASFRLGVLLSFLPAHASNFNVNVAQVGIIVAVGVIFVGILLPPLGIVADKLSRYHELLLIIIGSCIGITIFIVLLCHDSITLLLVNIIIGISVAMSIAVATDIAVIIGKKVGMGFWIGIFNSIIFLGVIVAPLISGAVMDYSGIDSVFHFAGILFLVFTFIGCYYIWKWTKVNKQE